MSRRALLVLAVVLTLLAPATGQTGFRVSHSVGRTTPTHVEITGTVTNETRADAVDVSVTVEALDAAGKRLARGISFVAPRVAPGTTAQFHAKVPVVAGVTSYRATVTSYRFMQGTESP